MGGVFDLLHYGHIKAIKTAKALGDHLTIAVNRDNFVYQYKQRYPIMKLEERIAVLRAIKYVDEVIINTGDNDWHNVLDEVRPEIIATSTEWAVKDYYKQMGVTAEELENRGIYLVHIPFTKEVSTTQIIERIKKCQ